jgi:ATP-binding cassette subfamily G (WHITE) protein 2
MLPKYFVWLDVLSYVKYSYVGVALNELQGLKYVCSANELNSAGVCPVLTGEQRIAALGLDYISIGGAAGCLIAFIVGCRFVAYLGLRFIKW